MVDIGHKMENNIQKNESIGNLNGKTIVVKYGGAAMKSADLKKCVISDIAKIKESKANVVIVHGGGPDLTALQERLGLETKFVDGLRFTDDQTIDAALMALCGKVNKDIVRLLENEGHGAVGLSGIDGSVVCCKKQENPDLGFVGEITQINEKLLSVLLSEGFIPVISSIGIGNDGNAYNINADTVAGRIAAELKADYYITLSDVPGVLKDVNDPESQIVQMYDFEAENFISDGVISGGMIPKIKGIVDAINRGAESASIVDGRVEHALLITFKEIIATERGETSDNRGQSIGTTILKGSKE